MNKRLCRVREYEELTVEEMAERIGVSAGELRQMECGDMAVPDAVAKKVGEEFYVSTDWLQDVPLPELVQSPEDRAVIEFAHRLISDPGLYPLHHAVVVLSKMNPDELRRFAQNFEKISMDIGY